MWIVRIAISRPYTFVVTSLLIAILGGLSPSDISAAISNQNLIIPAGSVKIGDTEYKVKLNSSPDMVEAFNGIPVKFAEPVITHDAAKIKVASRPVEKSQP